MEAGSKEGKKGHSWRRFQNASPQLLMKNPKSRSCCSFHPLHFLLLLLLLAFFASSLLHNLHTNYHEPHLNDVRLLSRQQLLTFDNSSSSVSLQGRPAVDDDEAFSCDRSHYRTDVCHMRGDVRVHGQSGSVYLYSREHNAGLMRQERLRPYTRKWETSIMQTVDEISLKRVGNSTEESVPRCDVQHRVPAIVFSTGGYTGNVYHDFNDGLIPLFISSQHLQGEVVFMILDYHKWWMTKYQDIVGQLTNHKILDFTRDKRVHCFPEIMVGLRIHDELAIDPTLMKHAVSMRDFQLLLHRAYLPRLKGKAKAREESRKSQQQGVTEKRTQLPIKRPKMVIVSRKSPRAILNEFEVRNLAEKTGFEVEILAPKRTTEMVDIYWILNSCDVMIGVHGAAMTHLLFMRPGSTFIQVVPLGTDWAAFTYYGEPARKLGLHYVEYKIKPQESSLSKRYPVNDPVIRDPDSVNKKGWWETKKIYLENQDVKLSPDRLRKVLQSAYKRAVIKSRPDPQGSSIM